MRMPTPIALMVLLPALLGACALSPQTVSLTPRIDVQSHPIGRDREIALEVVDSRPVEHFGARGGVYATALISPRRPVDEVVREGVAERLDASGFRVRPWDETAPLAMRVEIESLSYATRREGVARLVEVDARVNALVRNGGRTVSGQYRASNSRPVALPPDQRENEQMIDDALGEALRRILQDEAILKLLES